MEDSVAKLEAKLTQLRITRDRTSNVIDTDNRERVTRHQQALKSLVYETDCSRRDVEALKIAHKDLDETVAWNFKMEEEISKAGQDLALIQSWLEKEKRDDDKRYREEELEFERQLFETRLKFQTELHAAKANQKAQNSKQETTASVEASKGSQAKLPKLVITKFNGTYQDWPRFWQQFRETIDKTNIEAVIKFAYLRELLDVKVRKSVEALPFTSEGYDRAKSILEERYGKESEIIKAYTKQIMDLPQSRTQTQASPAAREMQMALGQSISKSILIG